DLVRRCQAGDTEAFDELVARYRTRVFSMIYNMVHSEQYAWDLAQDSFLKAWKSIKRFRGRSSFYTWIYRIVMNVTIDWLRKKHVKGAGAEFDDAIELREIDPASRTVPITEALPYETMERNEIRGRIEQAIAQPPAGQARETRSIWWTIPRLLWTGGASLAVFLVFTVLVMREKNPAEESQYLTQILNARVDPVVSPNATFSIFKVKQDRVTVLWTE